MAFFLFHGKMCWHSFGISLGEVETCPNFTKCVKQTNKLVAYFKSSYDIGSYSLDWIWLTFTYLCFILIVVGLEWAGGRNFPKYPLNRRGIIKCSTGKLVNQPFEWGGRNKVTGRVTIKHSSDLLTRLHDIRVILGYNLISWNYKIP